MTASSRGVKYAALLVAVLSHGALALVLAVPEDYLIEGGSGSAEVQLGDAFADLVAGTLSADSADTLAPERPTEDAARDMPDRVTPTTAARAEPVSPAPVRSDALTPAPQVAPQPAPQPAPPDVTPPEAATRAAPETIPDDALPVPADPAPQLAETFAPPASPARITATEPATPAITQSVRPPARPAPVVAANGPEPARAAPRGNADRNARAGDATGAQAATARHSGDAGQVQAAGNAAVSNYPGLVMRRLSRAGQPRVNARGAAVVAFVIGDTGRLTSVSLARSSGAEALDRAAVQLVQGAGPFPTPPAGAQRQFTIQIEGR